MVPRNKTHENSHNYAKQSYYNKCNKTTKLVNKMSQATRHRGMITQAETHQVCPLEQSADVARIPRVHIRSVGYQ